MNSWLHILLGWDGSSPGEAVEGSTRLEFGGLPTGAAALAAIAGAAVVFGLLLWLERRERFHLPLWRRGALFGLRLVVIAAAVLMFLEPVAVTSFVETVPSRLILLVDDSESMELSDPYTDEDRASSLAARLELGTQSGRAPADRLRETPRIALVRRALQPRLDALGQGRALFGEDLETAAEGRIDAEEADQEKSLEEWLASFEANRPVSPIGEALRGILNAHRGQPVAGIVVASDGRANAGEDPIRVAEDAARLGIPIHAILAGTEEGPRNVRLVEVEADPTVFVRDPTTVAVVVEARGLRDAEATIILERRRREGPWEPVGSETVVLGEEGQLTRAVFNVTPEVVGPLEYRARVEDPGPELSKDDNVSTASVRVVRQEIRVLMIAGAPSPEVQFLKNTFLRDPRIEFSGWYQHADPGYQQPGDRPIVRLPQNDEELSGFDVLLLFDPDMRTLGPRWPEMITNFVGREGGGLIFVAGELYTADLFDEAGSGAEENWTVVLPVVREPGLYRSEAQVRLSSRTTYALELTAEGRTDPIFAFHPDPIRNRAIFRSLPGMYWSFPVTRARPGATVLARHGDPRMTNSYGRHVLLATQLFGPGRSVFLAFDSTYRWRYLSEDYFDGFWARLIDRVGRSKALGGSFPFRVQLARSSYAVGEEVNVEVRYTDPTVVADPTALAAELEVADEPPEPVVFEKSPREPGLLTARFNPERAGEYALRIVTASGPTGAGRVRPSITRFRVEPPRRETDEPSLNRPMLEELARLTGGMTFRLDELDRLDPAIPMREVTRTLERREDLWDAPLFYATIVLGLTLEWILRKTSRLV